MVRIAYVEVAVVGGRRAYIEASSFTGLITSPRQNIESIGNKDAPITLVLRGGESFEIIGESVARLLLRAIQARQRLDIPVASIDGSAPLLPYIVVDFLDEPHGQGPRPSNADPEV